MGMRDRDVCFGVVFSLFREDWQLVWVVREFWWRVRRVGGDVTLWK